MGWLSDKKAEFKKEFTNALTEKSNKLAKEGKIVPLLSSESKKNKAKESSSTKFKEAENNKEVLSNSSVFNLQDYLTKQVYHIIYDSDSRTLKEVLYDKNISGVELAMYILNKGYIGIKTPLVYLLKNVYILLAYFEVLMVLLFMRLLDKELQLFFVPLGIVWIGYCFYIYYKEMKNLKLNTKNNISNNIDKVISKDYDSDKTIN